jgi:hypothetical protein
MLHVGPGNEESLVSGYGELLQLTTVVAKAILHDGITGFAAVMTHFGR